MITELKKIRFLINRKQKQAIIILTFLLIIGMFFEVLGLGAIIPVISLLVDPDKLIENEFISNKLGLSFIHYDEKDLVIFALLGLVLLYILKTIFLIILTYKQNVIMENLHAKLSKDLFSRYISQSYLFHVNRDLGMIIKNLQVEVAYFSSYFRSLLMIIIELFLSLSILITIIIIEPIGAFFVGILFSFLSIIYFQITKKKLSSWGEKRGTIDRDLSKISLESFNGIKDVKLLNKEGYFKKLFSDLTNKKVRISSNHQTISMLPRFYLELVSVIGLVFFIVLMQLRDVNNVDLISTLGVFVAATFRMIPSVNRLISGLQNLKFYSPSIHNIFIEFNNMVDEISKNNSKNFVNFSRELTIENLSYKYSNDSKLILNNISLRIKKGKTIGVIGSSGSGKSTFVDILNGLFHPTEGKIKADGREFKKNIKSWQKKIGYVGQEIFLFDDTIRKNIAFGLTENIISERKIMQVIKDAQLDKFVMSQKNGLDTVVGERGLMLSGGERQRVGIARALYNDPDILIFDEATASLDNKTEIEIMKSIYRLKQNKTIIIVAHRVSTLSNCDEIYEIFDGKIIRRELDD
tara:strand:+ start:1472 stop:3208 length:1737 start_codon:yes stop_codon:yes gene_type:complete